MGNSRVVTLMFHRVNDPSCGMQPQRFAEYLNYLVQHFPIVVPGERLPDKPIAVCLTFDDAYFDFYHDVYPLLQKHQIKALLAVPVKYIMNDTQLSAKARLAVPYPLGMDEITCQQAPFCTWHELREMAHSEHVVIASHGFSHANLARSETDVSQEIHYSKLRLEQELQCPIKSFVYPYGKITRQVHGAVCQTYDYGIRIGSALNLHWGHNRFIYRIDAKPLWTKFRPINKWLINKLTLKYWGNRVRLM